MRRTKLLTSVALAAAVALAVSACGGQRAGTASSEPPAEGANDGALIGVAMPTKTSERWIDDGDNVKAKLESLGYKVDLQYANDKVPDQQQQIENMLTKGAKALIIASIDGTALTQQLADAGDDGVKVIAYDRLINGSPERGLLRHLRQREGRRPAGHLAADRSGHPGRRTARTPARRARSTSSCSPAARTTTTPSSSSTAP